MLAELIAIERLEALVALLKLPPKQLERDQPQPINIARGTWKFIRTGLGSRAPGSSDVAIDLRESRAHARLSIPKSNPEIDQLDSTDTPHRALPVVSNQQKVVGLDVAMNEPFAVESVNRLRGLPQDRSHLRKAQRPGLIDQRGQRWPRQVLHHQVRWAVGQVVIEQSDDLASASERREAPAFLLQSVNIRGLRDLDRAKRAPGVASVHPCKRRPHR
jgi:hypothetical protein